LPPIVIQRWLRSKDAGSMVIAGIRNDFDIAIAVPGQSSS
jgi:hypothetical protein